MLNLVLVESLNHIKTGICKHKQKQPDMNQHYYSVLKVTVFLLICHTVPLPCHGIHKVVDTRTGNVHLQEEKYQFGVSN
jgi:hypothetical protein